MKEFDFKSTDTKFEERKIIICATAEGIQKLANSMNWKAFLNDLMEALSSNLPPIIVEIIARMPKLTIIDVIRKLINKDYSTIVLPFYTFELEEAKKAFSFPPFHPKDTLVYACCEFEPTFYAPLSQFHEIMYENKMNAFINMLIALKAKTIKSVYSKENGQEVKANIEYSFQKDDKPIEILENSWIESEPSWKNLQALRAQNKVNSYTLEFKYQNDMGINEEVAKLVEKLNLNIGGKFNKMVSRNYTFNIEFYEN